MSHHDLTLYFWNPGNLNYPNGHAAFRVRLGTQELVFNYDEAADVDPVKRRNVLDVYARLKLQRRSEQEQHALIGTATHKVKIPLINGGDKPWGLFPKTQSAYQERRAYSLTDGSISGVGEILDMSGARIFAKPPDRFARLNLGQLITWARAVQMRIDRLNEMTGELLKEIDHNAAARNYKFPADLRGPGRVISAADWRELSNRDVSNSVIRSSGIRKIDNLLTSYHGASGVSAIWDRLGILAELFEAIWEYNREKGSESARQTAVLTLASNIIGFMRQGGPKALGNSDGHHTYI
jgi:hypothetical protein